jgi:uncharacterized repeat protein (TIGR01451 family)
MTSPIAGKRLRFTPLALTTVLLSAGLLSMSVTGTLSGFAASITNSVNSASTGSLTMQETGPGSTGATVTCNSTDGGSVATNTATCATINKFGGSQSMVPGQTVTTTVVLKNTGTVRATAFSLTPGTTCTQTGSVSGSANDLCAKLNLTITQNGASSPALFSGTLASFAASTAPYALTPLASGASSTYVFTVTLDSSATTAYQGLTASMPMTWTFTS